MKEIYGQYIVDTKRKMNDGAKSWMEKLIKLEETIRQLNFNRAILISILSQLSGKSNLSTKESEQYKELQKEISYLDELLKSYKNQFNDCREKALKEHHQYASGKKDAKDLTKRTLTKYAVTLIPFIIIMLLVTSLFLLKPSITGRVILTKETTYNKSMNLEFNQSGNYTIAFDKPVDISTIRATGSVTGNGTVKIYVEKDGKRYLIYKNK